MTSSAKQTYIATLFSDEAFFEKEVLDIHGEADRRDVMGILADQMIKQKLRSSLHFSYIKELNQLSTEKVFTVLVQSFTNETLQFLHEKLRIEMAEAKKVTTAPLHMSFLQNYAKKLYARYENLILEKVADTLLERLAAVKEPSKAGKMMKKAVEGDGRDSMMCFNDGTKSVMKLEQAILHLHQALLARKREIQGDQLEVSKLLMKLREQGDADDMKRAKLLQEYDTKQKKLEALRKRPLDAYNSMVKRMKLAIVESIKSKRYLEL